VNVPALAVKVAEVVAAATVTEAGTVRAALFLLNATGAPPDGASPDSVTLHVVDAPDTRLVELQVSAERVIGFVKDSDTVLLKPPYAAVTVAVALAGIVPALATKVAEVAPAATVTEAGTVRVALLLLNATGAPPDGAPPDSVTLHVVDAPDPRLVELQVSAETVIGVNDSGTALLEPPYVAVTVAVPLAVIVPALATNVAEVAPAVMLTEAGTVRLALLLRKATEAPPDGAPPDSATIHVLEAPDARLVGEQISSETVIAVVKDRDAVFVEPPNVAATVAVPPLAVIGPALATNVAEVAPAVMLTEAGTVRLALLLLNATDAPPDGAPPASATVHVLEPPDPRLVGLQVSAEIVVEVPNDSDTVLLEPPYVATTVAVPPLAVIGPALATKVAEVAVMLTEAGTVRLALLLLKATEAPPGGMAPDSVTVHVLEPPDARLVGAQLSPETPVVAAPVVTVAPIAATLKALPSREAPKLPPTLIGYIPGAEAVTVATATIPSASVVWFTPTKRHV